MSTPTPGTAAWLDQVVEAVVEPALPIVDPHHHLWHARGALGDYLRDELWADTGSGHNVVTTVFVECGSQYTQDGPEHLRCVGETHFVRSIAAATADGPGARIGGIVGHADLRSPQLDEVLDAHASAGGGLFRGIRHAGARDSDPGALFIPGAAPAGLYEDAAFRAGLRRLGERGYTYDAWHYHHQNPSFHELAASAPGTTMVLDHFGTPLGVGRFAGAREAVFGQWRTDIERLAQLPNVVAKLGGLAMPDNGFGWHTAAQPPTSDELVAAQRDYYLHTIDCFGPQRCMFESNFPVDKFSLAYRTLYNGFKKMVGDFSAADKAALFHDTAARVYRL